MASSDEIPSPEVAMGHQHLHGGTTAFPMPSDVVIDDGNTMIPLSGHFRAMVYSATTMLLAIACDYAKVMIVDVKKNEVVRTSTFPPYSQKMLAWSPSGQSLAMIDNINLRIVKNNYHTDSVQFGLRNGTFYEGNPTCISWSNDGRLVCIGTNEGHILLFNQILRDRVDLLAYQYGAIDSVAWSPDDTTIAIVSGLNICIIRSDNGKLASNFFFPIGEYVYDVTWMSCNFIVVVCLGSSLIRLIDVEEEKVLTCENTACPISTSFTIGGTLMIETYADESHNKWKTLINPLFTSNVVICSMNGDEYVVEGWTTSRTDIKELTEQQYPELLGQPWMVLYPESDEPKVLTQGDFMCSMANNRSEFKLTLVWNEPEVEDDIAAGGSAYDPSEVAASAASCSDDQSKVTD